MPRKLLTDALRVGTVALIFISVCGAQDDASKKPEGASVTGEPKYPLSTAIAKDGTAFVVDLNLPGVWKVTKDEKSIVVRGSKFLRKALNRPRCVAFAPGGDLLIGDTASRDIYRVSPEGGEPKPLTDAYIGIPMSIAVDSEERVYVADLETRFILRFPLAGGKVETFAKVNTRGISFDSEGKLWAITQESNQLVTIDNAGKVTPVIEGRPFNFPHNVVVTESGDAYISDGYAKAIWRVAAGEQEATKWLEDPLLKNPVGLTLHQGALFVTDPHAKSLLEIELKTKKIKNRL